MDIERELTRDEEEFLHGKCHVYAIAMHRLTGLKLAATLDIDIWSERTVLVHAYVLDGERAVDVRGRFEVQSVREDFEVNDPWEAEISEADLMLLGSGRRRLNEQGRPYRKALALAEAMVDVLGHEDGNTYAEAPRPDVAPRM